jgi:hypothetical protein
LDVANTPSSSVPRSLPYRRTRSGLLDEGALAQRRPLPLLRLWQVLPDRNQRENRPARSNVRNARRISARLPKPFSMIPTCPRLDSIPLIEQAPATFRLTGFIPRAVRPRARGAWRGAQEWSKRRERQGRSETPRPHRWRDRRSARRRECSASGE